MTETAKQQEDMAHEVLDRTFVLSCQFDNHILNHPVVAENEELAARAAKISDALGELYQAIGAGRN